MGPLLKWEGLLLRNVVPEFGKAVYCTLVQYGEVRTRGSFLLGICQPFGQGGQVLQQKKH